MCQSFETPLHPGHGGDIHSSVNVEASEVPRPKILSEVPVPWYPVVQSKAPCVKSAVTAFLKSPNQTLKITSIRNECVKCSNYQAARKCDHWQIKCESSSRSLRSSPDFQTAQSCLLTPSPERLWAIWKSGYKEVKASGEGNERFKWLVHNALSKVPSHYICS